MGAKEKLIGILIVVAAAYPLVLKIPSVADSLKQYPFLTYLNPGEPLYHIILLLLGAFLLYTPKPRPVYPPHR